MCGNRLVFRGEEEGMEGRKGGGKDGMADEVDRYRGSLGVLAGGSISKRGVQNEVAR